MMKVSFPLPPWTSYRSVAETFTKKSMKVETQCRLAGA